MEEIVYKLNTNNSVLVVNAVDKLISVIKSKFKLSERQKFVLENEELKFLRDKCSSRDKLVSLAACQGLLALVELRVLEIAHTMSTVVTLLPTTHNYSAIISTIAGLLILDLKSRLVPGQPYQCQFSLKSPQHPFITVLEKNINAVDDILAQMQALCTHPDYIVSSNSLELLRPVFFWLMCHPKHGGGSKTWKMLLNLQHKKGKHELMLSGLSCLQICNPEMLERSLSAFTVVVEWAFYQQDVSLIVGVLPMLSRISNEIVRNGGDPRSCYVLIERCFTLESPELNTVAGLTVFLLCDNLKNTAALYLHEIFNLCFNIISKYEYSSISLNSFVALSLQWLNLPSYLTASALKTASKILDTIESTDKEDSSLYMTNLKTNKIFLTLLYTDSRLCTTYKMFHTWERLRNDSNKLNSWLDDIEKCNDEIKMCYFNFLLGLSMEKRKEAWFEKVVVRSLRILFSLIDLKKDATVQMLSVLLYKIANEKSPIIKMECLKAVPLMAKTKENLPTILTYLNKLRTNKGAPTSFVIMLFTSLAEVQVRCFPYLQELLAETGTNSTNDLKWEIEIARAVAVDRICQIRPETHGLELLSVISSILNRCGDGQGSVASSIALRALSLLWSHSAVAPHSAWKALRGKLASDKRPDVQISICRLLSEIPALRTSTPEYLDLVQDASSTLWQYLASNEHPEVIQAACDALSKYNIEDYTLKAIPEIYRRSVKLPASYCKTPIDAARKPEDVLDYVPCEVWPEVFKCTNQLALQGVSRLTSALMSRELRAYRSGVYTSDRRQEPADLSYLQPYSVVRGLVDCFKKQVTSPSYEYIDAVMLAILSTLNQEYPKPLPPLDLCFLQEAFHRGSQWKVECLILAGRQAATSGSARRLVDNFLISINENADSADIMLAFDTLPILCRTMSPNSLRAPISFCLEQSYSNIISGTERINDVPMLGMQLERLGECLSSDKIHDANRTLISQIIEEYFTIIDVDNAAWPSYVRASSSLCAESLQRMSSPSGWWEPSPALLRKACLVRCALVRALAGCDARPLVWLNDIIDALVDCHSEQQSCLKSIFETLQVSDPNSPATKEWFLQLLGRVQASFKIIENERSRQFLYELAMMSSVAISGCWSLDPDVASVAPKPIAELFPASLDTLIIRPVWEESAPQIVEWVWRSGALPNAPAALKAWRCGHARHSERSWMALERSFQ